MVIPMQNYFVTFVLNQDSRFWDCDMEQHRFFAVPGGFLIQATSIHHALVKAYEIGNKMDSDSAGKDYPSHVRSLSVGDLVVIYPPVGEGNYTNNTGARTYEVKRLGWEEHEKFPALFSENATLADLVKADLAMFPQDLERLASERATYE
jgi:hypothetical protein